MFTSERITAAFSRVFLRLQMVLCQARRDSLLYLQLDGVEPEFIVWVYPQKIQVTTKYASVLRQRLAAAKK